MESVDRRGRWLVSGVLGLAILGTAGCGGTTAAPTTREAGPPIVLNVPEGAAPSKTPKAKPSPSPSTVKAQTSDENRTSKQVPVAKPKSINDSPNTGRTPNTPPSPPSARTP